MLLIVIGCFVSTRVSTDFCITSCILSFFIAVLDYFQEILQYTHAGEVENGYFEGKIIFLYILFYILPFE